MGCDGYLRRCIELRMLQAAVERGFVMPRLVLSSALARWLSDDGGAAGASRECRFDLPGASLIEMLDALFEQHPKLRGYVLDERGRIRHHVAVFIDGDAIHNKWELGLALEAGSEVYGNAE